MLERLLLAAALVLLAVAGWRLANAVWLRRRAGRASQLSGLAAGRPAVVYFTAPGCLPCRTTQRPALAELAERYGQGLQIVEIDALAQPALADEWGVLTVPTTFIIDRHGRPRGVNHGVAGARQLTRQLAAIGEIAPAPVGPERLVETQAAAGKGRGGTD